MNLWRTTRIKAKERKKRVPFFSQVWYNTHKWSFLGPRSPGKERTPAMAQADLLDRKKQLLGIAVLLLLAGVTLFVVTQTTSGLDVDRIAAFLRSVHPILLVLSVVSALSCLVVEGWVCRMLCARLGHRVPMRRCVMWAASDYYISGITPLATGGQPAAAYFMQKDGVPLAEASLLLVLNTTMYQGALFLLGIPGIFIVLLSPHASIPAGAAWMLAYGFIAIFVMLVVCVLCMVRGSLVRRIGVFFIRVFAKLRLVKNPAKALASMNKALEEYSKTATLIGRDKKAVWGALGINLLQRFMAGMPVCLLALGLGVEPALLPVVFSLNVLCIIGASAFPIPGAAGVTELLFVLLLSPLLGSATESVMLITRLLVFYLCVLVGGVWTWARMMRRSDGNPETKD